MVRKVLPGALLLLLVSISLLQAQQLQPLPLNGRDSIELLTNGGFEIDTNTDKVPDGWKAKNTALPKSDKIKCDKPGKLVAHSGSCAFIFRANIDGSSSTLSQKITDVSAITDGTTLTFSAYIDPRSGTPGATVGKVNVKLSDGQQIKLDITVPDRDTRRGVADYVQVSISHTLALTDVTVTKIKVKLLNNQTGGKFFIDDVSLIVFELGATETPTEAVTVQATETTTIETATPTLTPIIVATNTPTIVPSNTVMPSPTITITRSMTPSPVTPSPTSTQTLTPTDGPSSTPTSTPTGAPCPCKLTASDGDTEDWFGRAIAVSGNTLVVGADRKDIHGAAYIYVWDGSQWTEQAKLSPSDAWYPDNFGNKVAIYGDTVIIGVPWKDDFQGAAYVFTRNGTTWTEQQKLIASDGAMSDQFGSSVAIYGDTAVVGAFFNDKQGSAYVFTRNGTTWVEQQKLTLSKPQSEKDFGYSVAITDTTVVIGVNSQNNEQNLGYVFTHNGTMWVEQQKLTADDLPDDYFTENIAINDNHLIVVTYNGSSNQGIVYIFIWNGTNWIKQQKLSSITSTGNNAFGSSIAIVDGTIIVGARGNNWNPGAAYIFTYDNGLWSEQEKFAAPDSEYSFSFGSTVALHNRTAIVGHPFDSVGENIFQGSVWVFDLP